MEEHGIRTSLKAYYYLVKYADTFEQVFSVYNNLKASNIEPNGRILEVLLERAKGTVYYSEIKVEKAIYDGIQMALNGVKSYKTVAAAVIYVRKLGLEYDIGFFNKMLLRLYNFEDMILLLDLIAENGFNYNHNTYWCFMEKSVELGIYDICMDKLHLITKKIGLLEMEELMQKYKRNSSVISGGGKYMIEISETIKKLKENVDFEESFIEQIYLMGVIDGLDSTSNKFKTDMNKEIKTIKELENEEDRELFMYDLQFFRGRLDGIRRREALYSRIRSINLPIMIIAYIKDEEQLNLLRRLAFESFFYEYDEYCLNKYNIYGFFFTSSLIDFDNAVRNVDYDMYDVAVNIVCGQSSNIFRDTPGNEEILNFLYGIRAKKLNHLEFIIEKGDKTNTMKDLFNMLYKDVFMKSQTELIDVDDIEDRSDDSRQ